MTITVAPLTNNHTIQPTVFGGNEDYGPGQATVASTGAPGGHDTIPNATYMRLGGNRLSSYNWENNADNAGADYGPHMSDLAMLYWVGATQDLNQAPALGVTGRYDQWRALGKEVMHTVQMMGWVAADNGGVVNAGQEPPSARWKEVRPAKGSAFTLNPNDNDAYVYMDESVNFLVNRYGTAASGGIKYYNLDNEPGAWDITHVRAHPNHITYVEMAAKSTATAAAITAVDPTMQVFGPAFWGYQDIRYFAGWSTPNAPDYNTYNPTYTWAMNFYLDRMRTASTAAGRRLLHYMDFHYYPEALGTDGNRIIYDANGQAGSTTQPCAEARMQAPRSLWDPTYIENSWYTGGTTPFQLLPRIQGYINTWYPGTKISISEYAYGADWDISGGIAQADMLGVMARFDVAGNYWQHSGGTNEAYTQAAFNLWLDYDGAGGKVGDIYADANTSDWTATSAYAARSSTVGNRLWVIVLNKNYSATQAVTINLGLTGGMQATAVAARRFGIASATLAAANTHTFNTTSISEAALPPRSATVYIVTLNNSFLGTPTHTPSRTPSPSPTRSSTPAITSTFSATRTPTATATRTHSPTVTRSNTAAITATFTATPTATGTATPTAPASTTTWTATRTRTGTPSPTPSASPSHTGTPTLTRSSSPTGTATPSASPSATGTATRTATPSITLTATVTVTFLDTYTHSPTVSPTPSRSGTPTTTQTRSPTPTASPSSTPNASPTATLSGSPSPTLSPSRTVTPTFTGTATTTATLTLTATRTVSPTPTPTPTPTITFWDTYTSSPTLSATPTLSGTPAITSSPSITLTRSPTATPTDTGTLTRTITLTATGSATAITTNSPTVTVTPTPTFSPLPTGSTTATLTATPTLSCTASPESGSLDVLEWVAWPNPDPKAISVKLSRSADRIIVKIWTVNLQLVCKAESGPAPGGWSQVALPAEFLDRAANGTYFFTVSAQRGEATAKGRRPGKLVVLH